MTYTATSAADGVQHAFKMLEGRWKLVILFHLFGGKLLRFSDLERAIPGISQKMLIQQLRQMESDGIVHRIVHHQVPPKVEYCLTDWGQALCPALDALLTWAEKREERLVEGPELSREELMRRMDDIRARSRPTSGQAIIDEIRHDRDNDLGKKYSGLDE